LVPGTKLLVKGGGVEEGTVVGGRVVEDGTVVEGGRVVEEGRVVEGGRVVEVLDDGVEGALVGGGRISPKVPVQAGRPPMVTQLGVADGLLMLQSPGTSVSRSEKAL
jgi:hypothetical protein